MKNFIIYFLTFVWATFFSSWIIIPLIPIIAIIKPLKIPNFLKSVLMYILPGFITMFLFSLIYKFFGIEFGHTPKLLIVTGYIIFGLQRILKRNETDVEIGSMVGNLIGVSLFYFFL
ncbi:MAG: hypothetical protein U0V04_19035 [Spirosomataceae bacterium]